jgi:hypothetical protein
MRNAYKIAVGRPEVKRELEDAGIGGKVIVEMILEK